MEKILSILSNVKTFWEKKEDQEKQQIRRILAIASLCLVIVIIITSLATCSNEKKFVGTWNELDSYGDIAYDGETLILASDGTGSVESDGMSASLNWSVEKNKVFITASMCGITETKVFTYKFSGDTMILTDEEDGEITVYRKK